MSRLGLSIVLLLVTGSASPAEDWPMFGRDRTRNAVSPEKGAPTDWQIESKDEKTGVATKARNILWSARLGSLSLGGPVVAHGLVWIGTNNSVPPIPKNPKRKDMSVLMCFRESDGKLLWQYDSPRLNVFVQDGPQHSMGTPLIEGDRLWLITNRCETVCFDIGPLHRGDGVPKELWKVDMRKELGVFPYADLMAAGFGPSPAADADRIFAVTSNGVDEDHITIPAPNSPSLVCFDKKTGKTLWTDASPGKDIMHSQRSSPLVVDVKGQPQVIVGQGDGWLRSFDAKSGKLIWKCDLNPIGSKFTLGGRSRKNYVMATPVFCDGRIYLAPGQGPEHGPGENELFCIDPTGMEDVSAELDDGKGKGKPNPNSRVVWRFGGPDKNPNAKRDILFCRTLANCTVADGLVYICDIDGYAYCLDAKTGTLQWQHDLKSECWTTALWIDGKVYITTTDGDVWIFAHGKEKKLLHEVDMNVRIRAMPAFANGVLYVMTENRLYAIREKK
jgi:outer membrane protein assembly factor BamB